MAITITLMHVCSLCHTKSMCLLQRATGRTHKLNAHPKTQLCFLQCLLLRMTRELFHERDSRRNREMPQRTSHIRFCYGSWDLRVLWGHFRVSVAFNRIQQTSRPVCSLQQTSTTIELAKTLFIFQMVQWGVETSALVGTGEEHD
jgi:hypothetical protein